jgi:CheY-like chemotaxis protein
MDGDQALCMAGELVPDVLLLDVEMPLIKRIEVARELRD